MSSFFNKSKPQIQQNKTHPTILWLYVSR